MITAGYLVITVMCLVVVYFAFRLWREHRNAQSLMILIVFSLLWIDNFAIGMGKFIGDGPVLTVFSYLRYYWHWQMTPLLVIVAGILLRNGGFAFAQNKLVMSLFCLVAVGFMVMDVPYIFQVDFYPACYGDTFRLATWVPEGQVCDPANPPPPGIRVSPFPVIAGNVILMFVGFALWFRHGFPWLAVVTMFMFVAGGVQQIPDFFYGSLVGNFGEPIFAAGLIATAWRFPEHAESDETAAPAQAVS